MSVERVASTLRRVIPDPFAIALGLTLLAFALAWVLGEAPMTELIDGWAGGARGFWSLLAFAMQMCLILITGYAVAGTRPVQRALSWVAHLPRNTAQAAGIISLCAMGLALLNWGLGLVGGALLAREVGMSMRERGIPVHYPLLGAAGYTGLCVWHGGFSGSAPLRVTQMSDLEENLGEELAARVGVIPMDQTVLSLENLVITGALLVLVPLAMMWMAPKDPEQYVPPPPRPEPTDKEALPGGAFDSAPYLSLGVAMLGFVWLYQWASDGGIWQLDPNTMNFAFLMVGLALAGSPTRYMKLAEDAGRACAGIIVQFPFYGGILGIMVAGGLLVWLAESLPQGPLLLPLSTFISGGLVNLFVPSGGGQWALQGPVVLEAALAQGIDPARVVMALSYGDQWTNLFQPFWALPLLGITGAKVGDVLGYTMILALLVGAVLALGVLLL